MRVLDEEVCTGVGIWHFRSIVSRAWVGTHVPGYSLSFWHYTGGSLSTNERDARTCTRSMSFGR